MRDFDTTCNIYIIQNTNKKKLRLYWKLLFDLSFKDKLIDFDL